MDKQKRLRSAEPLNCRLMSKGGEGGRHQTSQTLQAQCDASVNFKLKYIYIVECY